MAPKAFRASLILAESVEIDPEALATCLADAAEAGAAIPVSDWRLVLETTGDVKALTGIEGPPLHARQMIYECMAEPA